MERNAPHKASGGGFACPHRVETTGEPKLVLECRECRHSSPFTSAECMTGIVNAMGAMPPGALMFENHVSAIPGPGMQAYIGAYVDFALMLENLGGRGPPDPAREGCLGCTFNPGKLFSSLRTTFMSDPRSLRRAVGSYAGGMPGFRRTCSACPECLASTAEDMVHILDRYGLLSTHLGGGRG